MTTRPESPANQDERRRRATGQGTKVLSYRGQPATLRANCFIYIGRANDFKEVDLVSWEFRYSEYVPVAKKLARGQSFARKVAKQQGRDVQPVIVRGAKIATTFWGKAWCDHLDSYGDFANRLPRGRTYLRNGSVVDLQITTGRVAAIVAGSSPYQVQVEMTRLKPARWKKIRTDCTGSIDSLLDLLAGRFSDGVMRRLTDRSAGLFPAPNEISMACSCPDWATVCKHVAAVLYGVGAHLDQRPELLFLLRGVDHHELVSEAVSVGNLATVLGEPSADLAGEDLEAMFGIELEGGAEPSPGRGSPNRKRPTVKSSAGKRATQPTTTHAKIARKKAAKTDGTTRAAKAVKKKVAAKASAKKRAGAKRSVKKQVAQKKAVSQRALKKATRSQ